MICKERSRKNMANKAFESPVGYGFSRMCTCEYDNSLFFEGVVKILFRLIFQTLMLIFFFAMFVRDCDGYQIESSQTKTNFSHCYFLIFRYALDIFMQCGICIGRQRCKVNFLVFLKIKLKLKIKAFLLRIVFIDYFFSFLPPF